MNTTPLLESLALGGQGPYVWGALGLCVLCFGMEAWALRARRRALVREAASPAHLASSGQAAVNAPVRTPTLTRHGEST